MPPPEAVISSAPRMDSVGKGAVSIGGGRLIGMAIAFGLLMLLTRRGEQDVGVFRTLATFLLIAETVPLLGMHLWLATQMGTNVARRGLLFASSSVWAGATALLLAFVYVALAVSGLYDAVVSQGLLWIAFATLPSSVILVVQASLIGIGRSSRVGLLNLVENAVRSALGVLLIGAGFQVLAVIAMFVAVRWVAAFVGFRMVCGHIGPLDWRSPFAELAKLRSVVPRFAGVMLCALALRNAALVILPSLADTTQAGLFAVSYQLADLAMLVPTVFALSSTFVMSRGAAYSRRHLRRTMGAMIAVLSVLLFPVASLAIALAAPTLELLFGQRLLAAAPMLQLMMLATPLMAVDQVLSLGMIATQRYSEDLAAIALSAVTAIALTVLLAKRWGAQGAAVAFLLSMLLSLLARTWLMRDLRVSPVFWHAAWRAAVAAVMSGMLTFLASACLLQPLDRRWQVLWVVPGVLAYLLVFVTLGGARTRSRHRMLKFVTTREA